MHLCKAFRLDSVGWKCFLMFRIYNSQYKPMNYLTMIPGNQISNQKPIIFAQTDLYTSPITILHFLRLALTTSFQGFANEINKKVIQEELRNRQAQSVTGPFRPRAPSVPLVKEKPVKPAPSKTVQKSQASKAVPVAKAQKPKTTPPPMSSSSVAVEPVKKQKKGIREQVVSPKLKKKIHKIVEVKKENLGRVPRVSLIETAEMGSCKLGEKERRKLKERLLMRQVREWRNIEEPKRDRRDLRPIQ